MLDEFLKFIEDYRLIMKNDRILLAVSGGIDSMVMTDLFIRAGYDVGMAHCNFTLRAEESDMDEDLVRKYAAAHNIPFYSKKFDTKVYSDEKKVSIQMAARELRYTWFEEVRRTNGFESVAVAHNLNDNIETFLINLTRGTGIAGLSGMRKTGNRIIRPMLFASRQAIEEYSRKRQIEYREDKSNAETKYTRNKIRHLIMPLLREINPSIEVTLNETAERLSDINDVFTGLIEGIRKDIFKNRTDTISLNINHLFPYLRNRAILFELFRPYGISSGTLNDLLNIIKGKTGSQIFTDTHRIIRNRKEIIIQVKPALESEITVIKSLPELRKCSLVSSVRIVSVSESFRIPSDPEIACIDFQKVVFPLTIRIWHHGDFFYPLGMNRKKKLSDYFVDRKFSMPDKEKTLVLESAGKIMWIIGERIDNRVRITGLTKKAFIIRCRTQGTGRKKLSKTNAEL